MLDYDNRSSLGEFESQCFGDAKQQYKELLFLMPMGLMINLRVDVMQSFAQVKNQLWKQAESLPGYDTLHVPTRYAFNCYNSNLEKEEIFDENIRLYEFKIFRSIILVVEKIGDRDEKLFNMRIGSIICLPIFRILNMSGKEEKDFRRNIHNMCEEVVKERKNETIIQRMEEVFPPVLHPELSNDILEHRFVKFHIHFGRFSNANKYIETIIETDIDCSPVQVIQTALDQWYQLHEIRDSEYDPGLYFLKVSGSEEYLYGNHQIIAFKYVQKCLADHKLVSVVIVKRASLKEVLSDKGFQRCSSLRAVERETDSTSQRPKDLWDMEGKFSITVGKADHVLGEDGSQWFVKMCLYHGGEPLVAEVKTQSIRNPEWNELMTFDIDIADLPRNVRLCCVLFSVKKRRSASIAWANIPLFNYQGLLKSGDVKLHMWDCQLADESFNYIGTTTSNTKDECITLTLKFPSNNTNVKYPDMKRICSLSAQLLTEAREESERAIAKHGHEKVRSDDKIVFCLSHATDPPDSYIVHLTEVVSKDPLEDIFEHEKTLLWQMRVYCQGQLKNSLPKLLKSFDWSDHKKVAIVLKYESYLDNSLTRFLLKRAIKNSRIGHAFFWHLRSEMHQKEFTTRFGLILEAYCRANVSRTEQIWAQHKALELFHGAAKKAKEETKFSEGQTGGGESQVLTQVRQTLSNGNATLLPYQALSNPTFKVRSIVIEECRVMDSKKKPLWLTCKNHDDLGTPLIEMYKAGDDLRQDSLTLQTIGLMDELWQNENMDLKLSVYGCMATGENMGLISPVQDSVTLAKIQRAGGRTGAFNTDILYKWLQSMNKTDAAMENAISNFTKSCAGYCVATYVLGIGDRHSDNIMVTKSGKLFHIDFGHFLGNYKSLNIRGIGIYKRERVPMIMLSDFITVITKGKHRAFNDRAREDPLFKKFLETCLYAFIIIRNKSTLFINLFALMCSSGIPELSSLEDLRYLKDALSLDDTEEVAVQKFKKKMFEALKNEGSAKMNFFFHNIIH
ncbi:hypothetical protein ACHWQZ_G015451 [Mnemiopsis leidyi]